MGVGHASWFIMAAVLVCSVSLVGCHISLCSVSMFAVGVVLTAAVFFGGVWYTLVEGLLVAFSVLFVVVKVDTGKWGMGDREPFPNSFQHVSPQLHRILFSSV